MELGFIIGLIIIGIIFIIIEVFLIPGISIAGIAGTICMIGGVVLSYVNFGVATGTWILAISAILLGAGVYLFYRSKMIDRMSLKTEIDSKVEPLQGLKVSPGDKGISVSRLAPGGKVRINGIVVEGRCENEFIDENTTVEVVEVGTYNVLVRKIEQQ